jgi:hypothetical protein
MRKFLGVIMSKLIVSLMMFVSALTAFANPSEADLNKKLEARVKPLGFAACVANLGKKACSGPMTVKLVKEYKDDQDLAAGTVAVREYKVTFTVPKTKNADETQYSATITVIDDFIQNVEFWCDSCG